MRTFKLLSIFALAALVSLAVPAAADDNELSFKANNQVYNANGTFKNFEFTSVDIPGGDLTQGTVEMKIDLNSVDEKSPDLAEHLRQPDFFDVVKFPAATVKVHGITKTGDNTYDATATVNFMGTSNDVPVSFTVVSEDPLRIEGSGTMNRLDFGLGQAHDPENKYSIVPQVEISLKATLPTS